MARSTDVILVIDLESTCWEGEPPRGQASEIIEIGVCPLDVKSLTRREKRSLLVKPERSEISDYCSQLTTLTAGMFDDAGTLSDAVQILRHDYRSQERLWASWGDYDRRQFERVCRDFEIDYPFGPSHLNVKSLFASAVGSDREVGLDAACDWLNVKLEGVHHRGDDDAWNIARILGQILNAARSGLRVS